MISHCHLRLPPGICSHVCPLLTAPHDVMWLLPAGELPALPGLCDVAQPVADASYRADSRPPLLPGDRRPLAARVAAARSDKHAPPAELLVSERAAASQVSPRSTIGDFGHKYSNAP